MWPGVMVLSGAQEREALGFGQSAGSAATGPASWPPPQPPALAKHARPGQPGPCPHWSSLQSLPPSLQGPLLQETPLSPRPRALPIGRCWGPISSLPWPQAHRGLPTTQVGHVHTCDPLAQE